MTKASVYVLVQSSQGGRPHCWSSPDWLPLADQHSETRKKFDELYDATHDENGRKRARWQASRASRAARKKAKEAGTLDKPLWEDLDDRADSRHDDDGQDRSRNDDDTARNDDVTAQFTQTIT